MFRINLKTVLFASLLLPLAAGAVDIIPAQSAAGNLPMNTLEADADSYLSGADSIAESAVMSKDGKLMVVHDIFLDTTTDVAQKFAGRARKDGRYYVCDFTADELKTLRVTERFDSITHEPVVKGRMPDSTAYRIPTLDEALTQLDVLNDVTGRNVSVRVEVKEPAFFEGEGLDILAEAAQIMTSHGYNYKGTSEALTASADPAAVRSAVTDWECGLKTATAMHTDR